MPVIRGDLAHARHVPERSGDDGRVAANGRDDVDVAYDIAPTTRRPRDLGGDYIRMPTNRGDEPCRFSERAREKGLRGRSPRERDTGHQLLRGLRPEPAEACEAAIARCRLELVQRRDSELLEDLLDLRDAEPGYSHQLQHAFRNFHAKLLEVLRLAVLDQVTVDAERRGAESGNLRELALHVEGREVIGVDAEDRFRRGAISACLEPVLGAEVEELGDLGEDMGRGTGVHLPKLAFSQKTACG